jgi:hypothetical protein
MIKYKVARNPTFFGQNRKEDFKTFISKPKKVRVKDLPPHPLKNIVGVGDYRLEERVQAPVVETGTSTTYEFSIYGEGNISGIEKPPVKSDERFEFYDPNVRQEINRQKNRVTGTKSFNYFMIPKEPGDHKLKDYFRWVFFNPKTAKYDTLQSAISLHVTGESRKNEDIESNDLGNFYDQINAADNTLQASANNHWEKWMFNGLVVLLLGAAVWLAIKK